MAGRTIRQIAEKEKPGITDFFPGAADTDAKSDWQAECRSATFRPCGNAGS
jgi:hypothetical protein